MAPFTQREEDGDRLTEIPWNARAAGKVLLALAALSVLMPAGLGLVDGWDPLNLGVGAAVALALAWVGAACLANSARLRTSSDGRVEITHGPVPLMPGSRLRRDEVARVQPSNRNHSSSGVSSWRVELFTRGDRCHPLTVGGFGTHEEAERTAQAVRTQLGLDGARAP